MPAMNATTSPLFICTALVALCLAACSSGPAVPRGPVDQTTPAQRMAVIESVSTAADNELDVQPLRDPGIEDLRQDAARARSAGNLAVAGEALNQALLLLPDDPALLQERAEIALLQSDYVRAETLAKRAVELGSRTGPLCRRHWATIEQSRMARAQELNAASARAQIAGCTVSGLNRM